MATWSASPFPRENCLLAYTDVPSYGSSSTNYSVHLWDGSAGEIVRTLPLSYHCYGVAFSEDGRTLVTSTQNIENNPFVIRIYHALAGLGWEHRDKLSGAPVRNSGRHAVRAGA